MSDPAEQSLPPGYHLAEFEIIRVLGSGGFGITYLARDHSLEREVVIKENLPLFAFRDPNTSTVHPKTIKGEDADLFEWSLESFVREAKTLARFDHPNIVKILRVFNANGTAYFVMPYVEGETFSEWIAERKKKGETFAEDELRALLLPSARSAGSPARQAGLSPGHQTRERLGHLTGNSHVDRLRCGEANGERAQPHRGGESGLYPFRAVAEPWQRGAVERSLWIGSDILQSIEF